MPTSRSLKEAARNIYYRLMDAVDPGLVDEISSTLTTVPGVEAVDDIWVRWIGHDLRAEIQISVDGSLNVAAGHLVAVEAHHALLHDVHRLTSAIVHVHPSADWKEQHGAIAHHSPGHATGRGEQQEDRRGSQAPGW